LIGKGYVRVLALAAVLGVAAAACGGGSSNPSSTSSGPAGGPSGSVTVAVEQWPQCVNPIVTGCASASWTQWAVYNEVFPKAMVFDPSTSTMTNTALLTSAPSVSNGDVKSTSGGGMTVTFHINPAAKWDDGTPITSKDFAFTAEAMVKTKGSYYAAGSGYDLITNVDTSDPQTAVVTYKQIYADWPDDFGGLTEVLKAAAYTSPDISKVEQTSIDYSGAPWKLQSWSKSQEVLVPNTNYFVKADVPHLAKVIMVPREDQTTEINSILSGETDAASPQPSNVSIVKQIASNPSIKAFAAAAAGGYYEAHWTNDAPTFPAENGQPNPLADPKVREAYAYAVNRDEIIKGLIQLNQPDAQVLNCGLLAYPGTPYCQVQPFSKFTYNPQKSLSILKADGWDCSKVPSSPCTKGSETLNLLYATVAGNARRETTQELLKNSIKATGFDYTFKNAEATNLFGNVAPHGDFQVSDFAQGGTIDPGASGTLGCDSVPTKANGYGGGNFDRWCNKTFDNLLHKADQQLDQTKRVAVENQIMQYEADNNIFLPLYVLPQMLVWNSAKIASTEDITKWVPTPQGPLYGMEHWYMVGS
jgi:peptide/nickel transport system substrate-binding protein